MQIPCRRAINKGAEKEKADVMQGLLHQNNPALRKDLVRWGCRDRPGPETPKIAF